jgi:hypothetical protein
MKERENIRKKNSKVIAKRKSPPLGWKTYNEKVTMSSRPLEVKMDL